MSQLLHLLEWTSFLGMLLGLVLVLVVAFRQRHFLRVGLIVLVPFYIVAYILGLGEGRTKKIAGVLVMGCFVVYVFASLFLLLLKPPVP